MSAAWMEPKSGALTREMPVTDQPTCCRSTAISSPALVVLPVRLSISSAAFIAQMMARRGRGDDLLDQAFTLASAGDHLAHDADDGHRRRGGDDRQDDQDHPL